MKTEYQIECERMYRMKKDHRQLVEDYHKYQGQSCQPSWVLVELSAKAIAAQYEELETLRSPQSCNK